MYYDFRFLNTIIDTLYHCCIRPSINSYFYIHNNIKQIQPLLNKIIVLTTTWQYIIQTLEYDIIIIKIKMK